MTALSLEIIHTQIPARMHSVVDEGVVEEIQKLSEDPDYGEDFVEQYVDYLNVLDNNPRRTHTQYLKALKFFTLVMSNHTLTDAYIKVFPERYIARTRNSEERDPKKKKQLMRGEASRYNSSQLLQEIRKAATVPIKLTYRHILHEAILTNADIMRNSRSDMVRQKAADTLIRELKEEEDQVLHIEVEDGAKSAIQALAEATEALAQGEYDAVRKGVPLKAIAERDIIEVKAVPVDESEITHIPVALPAEKTEEETSIESTSYNDPVESSIPVPDIEEELVEIEEAELGEEEVVWKL